MRWTLKQKEPWHGAGPSGMPTLVQRLLGGRGLASDKDSASFLNPGLEQLEDPFLLPQMEQAVDRVESALRTGERIFVFGDYDVDGLTSAEMLRRYLTRRGGDVVVRVPERLTEGYGLSIGAVLEARACGSGLIMTADCGTNATKEIALARDLDVDVIVLDHHVPERDRPPALALVNPWLPDCRAGFRDLCAGGVVAKLLDAHWRSRVRRGADGEGPQDLLDFAALACVADSVPLRGDNRVYVSLGLRQINRTPRPWLRALLRTAGKEFVRTTATGLAFHVIPRINAAGRLGDVDSAMRLLRSDDPVECQVLAEALERHNQERRRLLEQVFEEACAAVARRDAGTLGNVMVLASEGWHAGVLGIAAARMAERYGVSVLLLGRDGDLLRGSGRAAGESDLLSVVKKGAQHLRTFGGHRAAVGLTLDAVRFDEFRAAIEEAARGVDGGDSPRGPGLEVDDRAELADMDWALTEWIGRLEPFGPGHPEPVWALKGRASAPRILKEKHLKFDLRSGRGRCECIAFGLAEHAQRLGEWRDDVHVAATLTRNAYRGEDRLQLVVKDIRFEDPFGHD